MTIRSVDSPEFRAWFGDSKVVDEQGRPLVVYHGGFDVAGAKKPEFRISKRSGYGSGVYFTPQRSYAEGYARQTGNAEEVKNGVVGEYLLRVERPFLVWSSVPESDILVRVGWDRTRAVEYIDRESERYGGVAQIFQRELQPRGFDGLFVLAKRYAPGAAPDPLDVARDVQEIVIWEKTQVKSVFNRGTWERWSANVLKGRR